MRFFIRLFQRATVLIIGTALFVTNTVALSTPVIAGVQRPLQSSNVRGRVTYRGSPIQGIRLKLNMIRDNTRRQYLGEATSQSDGTYQFDWVGSLPLDSLIVLDYESGGANPEGINYLWYWRKIIRQYSSDNGLQCSFDVANVRLVSPESQAQVSLPHTFQWERRVGTPTDSYVWMVWGIDWVGYPLNAPDPEQSLGYVDSIIVDTLPQKLRSDTSSIWTVGVVDECGGLGIPSSRNEVAFTLVSENTATPIQPTATFAPQDQSPTVIPPTQVVSPTPVQPTPKSDVLGASATVVVLPPTPSPALVPIPVQPIPVPRQTEKPYLQAKIITFVVQKDVITYLKVAGFNQNHQFTVWERGFDKAQIGVITENPDYRWYGTIVITFNSVNLGRGGCVVENLDTHGNGTSVTVRYVSGRGCNGDTGSATSNRKFIEKWFYDIPEEDSYAVLDATLKVNDRLKCLRSIANQYSGHLSVIKIGFACSGVIYSELEDVLRRLGKTLERDSSFKPEIAKSSCSIGHSNITSPSSGQTIRGVVSVIGTAGCDGFAYYKFEFVDPRCGATGLCFVAGQFTIPIVNGLLMNWDTSRTSSGIPIPNGIYKLRLTVVGVDNPTGNVLPEHSEIIVTIKN